MTKLRAVFIEIRVWQWAKNVLVFAPVIFGAQLFNVPSILNAILIFFAMSFAASTAYVLNDLFDIKADRQHPTKKNRPLAKGTLSLAQGRLLMGITLLLSVVLGAVVSPIAVALVLAYLVLNLFYSKVLKHRAIIDILIVAFFYIYRVVVGAIATNLPVSGWLLLTTFFVALFLITGKRRAELVETRNNKGQASRKVLGLYNQKFLDAGLVISLTLFVTFYSLYSVLVQSDLFILTILPVVYISLRYLYLIFVRNEGEEPEKLVFKDREIFIAGIILGILVVTTLYINAPGIHL